MWKGVTDSIDAVPSAYDQIRRDHLKKLADHSKRNVIAYYSGWLQKSGMDIGEARFMITDEDKSGFMAVTHNMDKGRGLDLIIHSPGGDVGATESIGDYLLSLFGKNIRTIVPQLAMSCGSMLACLGKTILMGKHSSLGPVDPIIGGTPAVSVVNEFKKAFDGMKADPSTIPYWQMVLSKYQQARFVECKNAIDWSQQIVEQWLASGMFGADAVNGPAKAKKVAVDLVDHTAMKAHNRHISAEKARQMDLDITMIEEDQVLQDLILTVHHCYIATVGATNACKIIENQDGLAVVSDVQIVGFKTA